MLTVSRRAFFVLGGTGAAGAALSACGQGADLRADAAQPELADAELSAELALATAYGSAAGALRPGEERVGLEAFAEAAGKRADELRTAGASPGEAETTAPDGGPDSAEALDGAIRAANEAIAAHRQAAGLLDTAEGRALAASSMAACAAELAAVNGFAGKPPAPSPFVTGGPAPPYESTAEPAGSTTTTSTTSTSTTTAP